MTDSFFILVVDRNPNIREFLHREFSAEGYGVFVARDSKEVLDIVKRTAQMDLVILDLDMPDGGGLSVLEWLQGHYPGLPVIVHTYHAEHANNPVVRNAALYFEKKGNNIDGLKAVAAWVLRKWHSHRFEAMEKPTRDVVQGD